MTLRLVAGIAVATILQTGCFVHRTIPYVPSRETGTRIGTPSGTSAGPYDYQRAPVPVSNHDAGSIGPYDEKVLTFPSWGENGQPGNLVRASYFQGRAEGAHPLVVLLPVWGRPDVYPVRHSSQALRSRFRGKVHVVVMEGPNRVLDMERLAASRDVEEFRATARSLAERCRTAVIDTRRLIDWLEPRTEVDSHRIAVVGFSIGAMFASGVALSDPRVETAVIAFGGTRPWEILAQDRGRTAIAREEILARFGWDARRYEEELEAAFGFLDARLAGDAIDPSRVLMFEARRDRRFPPSSRAALWEAMGRPELVTVPYRHRGSFLTLSVLGVHWGTRRILGFLEDNLLSG